MKSSAGSQYIKQYVEGGGRIGPPLTAPGVKQDEMVCLILRQNLHKAHSCDTISMAMLKLCPNEIAVSLSLIFLNCIDIEGFLIPGNWPMSDQFTQKNDMQVKLSTHLTVPTLQENS